MMGKGVLGFLGVLFLVFIWTVSSVDSFRTCQEARKCCPGRNNTCFAFGPRMDRNENESRCFCDENCKLMGDCCIDYDQNCQGVDCIVSEWGRWEECNNQCGLGSQPRKRKIHTPPMNGGKKCPILKQKRVCVGNDCLLQSVEFQREEMQEVGQILPATYGIWRESKHYSPNHDIRRNLFARYDSNEVPTRLVYRGKFTIVSSRKSCNSTSMPWAQNLVKGAKVCVECQPFAMDKERGMRCIGHGVQREITKWNAVDVPHCHGEWVMTSKHESDTCNLHGDGSFILI